jgi:hypothetical protein
MREDKKAPKEKMSVCLFCLSITVHCLFCLLSGWLLLTLCTVFCIWPVIGIHYTCSGIIGIVVIKFNTYLISKHENSTN